MKELPEEDKSAITTEVILKQPFVRRMTRVTNPYSKHEKEMKKAKIASNSERQRQNLSFDATSQAFYDKETTMDNLRSELDKFPDIEQKRLWERHRKRGTLQELPDRRWWLNLSDISQAETKALTYWNRWRAADDLEKERLEKYLYTVPGVRSARFFRKLESLKRGTKE